MKQLNYFFVNRDYIPLRQQMNASFGLSQMNRICFIINFTKVFEITDDKSGFDYI